MRDDELHDKMQRMTKGKLIALGLALLSTVTGVAWQQGLIPVPEGACPQAKAPVCDCSTLDAGVR